MWPMLNPKLFRGPRAVPKARDHPRRLCALARVCEPCYRPEKSSAVLFPLPAASSPARTAFFSVWSRGKAGGDALTAFSPPQPHAPSQHNTRHNATQRNRASSSSAPRARARRSSPAPWLRSAAPPSSASQPPPSAASGSGKGRNSSGRCSPSLARVPTHPPTRPPTRPHSAPTRECGCPWVPSLPARLRLWPGAE